MQPLLQTGSQASSPWVWRRGAPVHSEGKLRINVDDRARIWTLISLRHSQCSFPPQSEAPNEKYHHRGICFTKYHLLYLSVCEHTMRGTEQGWFLFYRWGNRGCLYVESDTCMYYALHIIPVFTERKRKLRATKLPTYLHILYIFILCSYNVHVPTWHLQCYLSKLQFLLF